MLFMKKGLFDDLRHPDQSILLCLTLHTFDRRMTEEGVGRNGVCFRGSIQSTAVSEQAGLQIDGKFNEIIQRDRDESIKSISNQSPVKANGVETQEEDPESKGDSKADKRAWLLVNSSSNGWWFSPGEVRCWSVRRQRKLQESPHSQTGPCCAESHQTALREVSESTFLTLHCWQTTTQFDQCAYSKTIPNCLICTIQDSNTYFSRFPDE